MNKPPQHGAGETALIGRITDFHHRLLRLFVRPGDLVVDGTVGNGHDTLFLLRQAGPDGRLFGFDIQGAALAGARRRLEAAGVDPSRYTLIEASHAEVVRHVPPGVGAAVFNLGYLPGGDREITTDAAETLAAVRGCLALLRPEGIVSIVLYYAHAGGSHEASAVLGFASRLEHRSYKVLHLAYPNLPRTPPSILVVQKG